MRKERSDKGGKHNWTKNTLKDIKMTNKQQLIRMMRKNIVSLQMNKKQILSEKMADITIRFGGSKETVEHMQKITEQELNVKFSNKIKQIQDEITRIEQKKKIGSKQLEIMRDVYLDHRPTGRTENMNMQVINILRSVGMDVSNPTALSKALGGYTLGEIYEGWTRMPDNGDDYYKYLHGEDEIQTLENLKKIVNFLNKEKRYAKQGIII